MSTRSTLARTLAGALAIAALAAPSALARPAAPDWPTGLHKQAPVVQNLRSPDAQDAATQAAQVAGGPSAQGRYYASYGHPSPLPPVQQSVSADDGGTHWATIAGASAALLLLVGWAAFAGRSLLRTRRAGAAV